MTDRHAGYIVVLKKDIREDDAEAIVSALRMVKGVQSVEPIISSPAIGIAESRRNGVWREALYDLIRDMG